MKILEIVSEIPCRVSRNKPVLAYNGEAFDAVLSKDKAMA